MAESKTKNAVTNIRSGLLNNFIVLFIPFIVRTVMIKVLGSDYLGLDSLFTSILQVINMAELGFSSTIVFSLYQPLAENHVNEVCAYMALYRKVYSCIGCIVLAAGIVILPFLPQLINGTYPQDVNLYIIYFMYLINTSLSYFLFAYKGALLTAAQKQSHIYGISSSLSVFKLIFQIVVLVILKNYYLYLVGNLLYTIIYNLMVARVTKKEFPLYVCKGTLDKESINKVTQQVKGLVIGKISYTSRNSFDSILISMICGLTVVAVYSNYYYIFSAALGIILVLGQSITAGIGNCIATVSAEVNYTNFKKFNFYYNWIGCWFSICLLCLYQPFMKIWVGNEFTASYEVMFLFVIYFYVTQVTQLSSVYAAAAGIWWEIRFVQIGEMITNLALNILLGWKFGVVGILWATIISVFVYCFIMQTIIGFKCYFKRTALEYFWIEFKWLICFVCMSALSYGLCSLVNLGNITKLIYCALICILVPNIFIVVGSFLNKKNRPYLYGLIYYLKAFLKK